MVDIVLISAVCTLLSQGIGVHAPNVGFVLGSSCTFLAYVGMGSVIRLLDRQRRLLLDYADQLVCKLDQQKHTDKHTEQQFQSFLRSVPAAILSLDPMGRVEVANEALHELLGRKPLSLQGEIIDEYLPDLARLRRTSRLLHLGKTMIEGTGYRSSGEAFMAHIWVSSYGPPSAPSLTAIVFDASERFRELQHSGLYTLTASTRVIMAAFWHETRNLSSAMHILLTRLMNHPEIAETEELIGLKSLVSSLEKLAYSEQNPVSDHELETASVRLMLDHLRILTEPLLNENKIYAKWRAVGEIPLVCGDRDALLQVCLNIVRNASRALEEQQCKELLISAGLDHGRVIVSFTNNGPPVTNPELLFTPFQPGASQRGLGLYVSRAILRSFGGDLVYRPVSGGCCFLVTLQISQFWAGERGYSSRGSKWDGPLDGEEVNDHEPELHANRL